jgi:hypothetical protein
LRYTSDTGIRARRRARAQTEIRSIVRGIESPEHRIALEQGLFAGAHVVVVDVVGVVSEE